MSRVKSRERLIRFTSQLIRLHLATLKILKMLHFTGVSISSARYILSTMQHLPYSSLRFAQVPHLSPPVPLPLLDSRLIIIVYLKSHSLLSKSNMPARGQLNKLLLVLTELLTETISVFIGSYTKSLCLITQQNMIVDFVFFLPTLKPYLYSLSYSGSGSCCYSLS